VLLAVDHPGGEPVAEQVPGAGGVAPVVRLRVDAVQVVQATGELELGRVDDQVVVRAHEAVAVDSPAMAADGDREQAQEEDAVGVVAEGVLRVHRSRRDVEQAVGKRPPQTSRHRSKLAQSDGTCQCPWDKRHTFVPEHMTHPGSLEGQTLSGFEAPPGHPRTRRAGPEPALPLRGSADDDELSADLAGRVLAGMHVHIRATALDRGHCGRRDRR
jgi:hypothetical protein